MRTSGTEQQETHPVPPRESYVTLTRRQVQKKEGGFFVFFSLSMKRRQVQKDESLMMKRRHAAKLPNNSVAVSTVARLSSRLGLKYKPESVQVEQVPKITTYLQTLLCRAHRQGIWALNLVLRRSGSMLKIAKLSMETNLLCQK